MATVTMGPGLLSPQKYSHETLSTLSDPQTPLTPSEISSSDSTSPHHPEISNEVAALSNKLIHAINHQTDLDDTLSDTRHQLEAAQERIRHLERGEQEHQSLIENRILVKWVDVENDTLRLRTNLAEERKQRVQAENEKKSIEHELESLTTALFEEANQMVSAARRDARKEREIVERRNEQVQAQLNDAELLLATHQEQLAELKQAMQAMSVQRNELETAAASSTAPSTPALETQDHMNKLLDALHLSPTTPGGEGIPPASPTNFAHLISLVLRTDVQPYEDFHALLDTARNSGPPSRVPSGNYGGLAGLGLSSLGKSDQPPLSSRMPSNGSTSSLSASNTYQSSPSTPNLPPSTSSSISSRDIPANVTPLKETSFYKRVLVEDIEPTLRLDTAPGLSWLARRSVISSMCEGRLIVEPMPPTAKLYHPPCSLCGEQGRAQGRARTHQFRTSESETAQRYPLCEYCLYRVRSTCDFLGFLRMVKDGHWRIDGQQAEAVAWEESVRLREKMFWSRIGGGVVPAFLRAKSESPRSSTEEAKALEPFPSSQTSLTSQASSKPEQPSPLGHEIEGRQASSSSRERGPKDPSPAVQLIETPDSSPLPQLETANLRYMSVEKVDSPESNDEPSIPVEQPASRDRQESSFANENLSPLTRTNTRSRGSSRTEPSGRAVSSIARRAAMFERATSEDAASNQLQASLQASIQNRSPSRGRDVNSSVPGAFEF